MTWLNINPRLEPWNRVNAAQALAANPENRLDLLGFDKNSMSSTEVAQLYNNAESLGLDLLSVEVTFLEYDDEE